jgi:hypothetical protein
MGTGMRWFYPYPCREEERRISTPGSYYNHIIPYLHALHSLIIHMLRLPIGPPSVVGDHPFTFRTSGR